MITRIPSSPRVGRATASAVCRLLVLALFCLHARPALSQGADRVPVAGERISITTSTMLSGRIDAESFFVGPEATVFFPHDLEIVTEGAIEVRGAMVAVHPESGCTSHTPELKLRSRTGITLAGPLFLADGHAGLQCASASDPVRGQSAGDLTLDAPLVLSATDIFGARGGDGASGGTGGDGGSVIVIGSLRALDDPWHRLSVYGGDVGDGGVRLGETDEPMQPHGGNGGDALILTRDQALLLGIPTLQQALGLGEDSGAEGGMAGSGTDGTDSLGAAGPDGADGGLCSDGGQAGFGAHAVGGNGGHGLNGTSCGESGGNGGKGGAGVGGKGGDGGNGGNCCQFLSTAGDGGDGGLGGNGVGGSGGNGGSGKSGGLFCSCGSGGNGGNGGNGGPGIGGNGGRGGDGGDGKTGLVGQSGDGGSSGIGIGGTAGAAGFGPGSCSAGQPGVPGSGVSGSQGPDGSGGDLCGIEVYGGVIIIIIWGFVLFL